MDQPANILVCVTQQKTCERLIRRAVLLKEKQNGDLFVIHVAHNNWNFLDNAHEGEALEYLFSVSKAVGANLTVLKSDNIIQTIADYAHEHNIKSIVIGESPKENAEGGFINQLVKKLGDTRLVIVPQNDDF